MTCYLHFSECACALGSTIEDATQALHDGHRPVIEHTISHLQHPLSLPYFSLNGQALDEHYHNRLWPLLCSQLDALFSAIPLTHTERKRTGLFIGSSGLDVEQAEVAYQRALRQQPENAVPLSIIGYHRVGHKLARHYHMGEVQCTVTTACTSSANALLMAERFIRSGRIDHAIVVGFELFNEMTFLGFKALELISPSGDMRPFDDNRDGLILGEGCSVLFLSREHNAAALSVLGGANCTDSHSLTAADPNGNSVARVIQQALDNTGIKPEQVVAIKAHGTASALNDEAEAKGIQACFRQPPEVFVLKPYIGHTLGACGAIETSLLASSLADDIIPGNAGIGTPGNALGIQLNQQNRHAPPGCYLLSFFAFGGNNSAVVLGKEV